MIPLTVFGIPSNVVGMDHEVYLFFKYRSNIGKHSTCYYYYRPNCFLLLGPQRESITRANTHLIGGQKEECQGFIIIGSTAIYAIQLSHSWPSRNLLLCIKYYNFICIIAAQSQLVLAVLSCCCCCWSNLRNYIST